MTESPVEVLGDIRLQRVTRDHPLCASRMVERAEHMSRNFAEKPWDFCEEPPYWVEYLNLLASHGGVFVDAIDMDRGGKLIGFCVGIPHVDEEVVSVTELGKFGLRAGDAYCAAVVLDTEYRGKRDANGQKVYPRLCDARHQALLGGNTNPDARFWVRTHVECHAVRRIFERAGYRVAWDDSTNEEIGFGCKDLGGVVWNCVIYRSERTTREDRDLMFFYGEPEVEHPVASAGNTAGVPVEGNA